jgi:hypothetical protein
VERAYPVPGWRCRHRGKPAPHRIKVRYVQWLHGPAFRRRELSHDLPFLKAFDKRCKPCRLGHAFHTTAVARIAQQLNCHHKIGEVTAG